MHLSAARFGNNQNNNSASTARVLTTIMIQITTTTLSTTTTTTTSTKSASNSGGNDSLFLSTADNNPTAVTSSSAGELELASITTTTTEFPLLFLSSNSGATGGGGSGSGGWSSALDDVHSITASLELQRYAIIVLLVLLIIYISFVNLFAITTLAYGMTASSAAVTVRMVCLKKKPIRLVNIDDDDHITITSTPNRKEEKKTPPSSSENKATITHEKAEAVRSAVIATAQCDNNNVQDEDEAMEIDSSAFPYLLSLAISDFLIGSIIAPLQLDIYVHNKWRFSSDICDFWLALDIFFSTSSTLHTAAIAVDRWWTITRLQAGDIQMPQINMQKTMLIFIWMLSALISFPVIYLWQIETPGQENRKRTPEQCEPVADDTYILLSTLVSFCLPLALTIMFYFQTAMRIRKQFQQAKVAVRQLTSPFDEIVSEKGNVSYEQASKEAVIMITCRAEAVRILEKHLQTLNHHRVMLRAMSLVVIIYCVCWMPLYTMLFVKAVCDCFVTIKAQHTWGSLVTMFSWLGYANSGINPIIYFGALDEVKALAKAVMWVIAEQIRKSTATVFVHLKSYMAAVFCCFLRRPAIYIISRSRGEGGGIQSPSRVIDKQSNVEKAPSLPFRYKNNDNDGKLGISVFTERDISGEDGSSSSSSSHSDDCSTVAWNHVRADEQRRPSITRTSIPAASSLSVPIQHKFVKNNSKSREVTPEQFQDGPVSYQHNHYQRERRHVNHYNKAYNSSTSSFSNPNLVIVANGQQQTTYYCQAQQQQPQVAIVGGGKDHYFYPQNSYTSFTDNWGRPLKTSKEATV